MRHAWRVLRVEADIRRRIFIDRTRWRLLRLVPRRALYFLVIRATAETLRGDEHPDAIGAMEVVRRLERPA